jgi:ribosomal subunit interface protein
MESRVQITFQGIPPSDAVRAAVFEHMERIERHHRVNRSRIVIAAPHLHSRHGNLYSVRIDATVPGAELFVNRDHHDDQSHEDVYVALRDAFEALERQFARRADRHARRRPERQAAPVGPSHGVVTMVLAHMGYGYIESDDGHEVYFHQDGLNGLDINALEVGSEVSFIEFEGDQGNQARAIRVVARPVAELIP